MPVRTENCGHEHHQKSAAEAEGWYTIVVAHITFDDILRKHDAEYKHDCHCPDINQDLHCGEEISVE